MRNAPQGVFATAEGIGIKEDDGSLTLTCQTQALIGDDDAIVMSGVILEVATGGEGEEEGASIESAVMLEPDECDALADFLREAAESVRSGQFEKEVREGIEQENADRR